MKSFKFFQKKYIAVAHDGGYIYAGETLHTMNKERYMGVSGIMIEKYTIVRRCVSKKYGDIFRPDYNSLWYFKSKQNAEYLRTLWVNDDRMQEVGEIFYNRADIRLTFTR